MASNAGAIQVRSSSARATAPEDNREKARQRSAEKGEKLTLALHEAFEVARTARLTQLAQCLGLDLTDSLARDSKLFADFLERVVGLLTDSEAHPEYLLFARRERCQNFACLLAEVALDRSLYRRGRELILDEVAQRTLFLVADRRLERNRLFDDLEDLLDLVERHLHLLGDFFRSRFTPKPLDEQAGNAQELVDRLDHMHRNADGAALVGDRARH